MRSGSWPITTTTGDSPAARARRTARRTSDSPSSCNSILFRPGPMRRDAPAARITPATREGRSVAGGMDRGLPIPQGSGMATGTHSEDFGDNRQRYLLGAVGPDVQADRPVHPRIVDRSFDREVPQHPLGALPRSEHANVGDG